MACSIPHAVIIPYPAQGHITPMLQLAKLLHLEGFNITFVNTEYNHRRLLRSGGPDSLDGSDGFRFEAITDGLPPSDDDVTQDIPELCISTRENSGIPFRELIVKLNSLPGGSPVSCIIADVFMSFTLEIAKEFGIMELVFSTMSACGFMGYIHFFELIERGYTPLKGNTNTSFPSSRGLFGLLKNIGI